MSTSGDRWESGNKPGREDGSPGVSEIIQEISNNCGLLKTINQVKRGCLSQR
jgi:hypothetical protein